uniref:Nas2 N-terminal domain-containing protein n=1 Tax=Romanomermis culicivorax TaxID=13658 RepID=A0A915KRK2_ROMCU
MNRLEVYDSIFTNIANNGSQEAGKANEPRQSNAGCMEQGDALKFEQSLEELKIFDGGSIGKVAKASQQNMQPSGINMNDPLVDQEGFPRNDIDVALIRQTRHDIICLQNDLKALMNQLEKEMQEYYEDGGTSLKMDGIKISDSFGSSGAKEEIETCNRTSNTIFIKIDDVMSNSPSSESGLLTGDLIIQFGSVCADTFKNLSQIQEMIARLLSFSVVL